MFQIGQPVVIRPGINYLAVKIMSAENLLAADAAGTSDAYFEVEWDGSVSQTPVVMKSLNPVYNYTLYFAIKVSYQHSFHSRLFEYLTVHFITHSYCLLGHALGVLSIESSHHFLLFHANVLPDPKGDGAGAS